MDGHLAHSDYGQQNEYFRRFYDRYVDETVQPFTATTCNFPRCDLDRSKTRNMSQIRAHVLSHFKGEQFEKFVCRRCNFNNDAWVSLKAHKCLLRSDFPRIQHFIDKCLAAHPKQLPKSMECSKCKEVFDSLYKAHYQFLSCTRTIIACIKCDTKFGSYLHAKLHYESCNQIEAKTRRVAFQSDKVKPPTTTDDRNWSEKEMMTHIREITSPKIRSLFSRFPNGALGYVGMTSHPTERFTEHAATLCVVAGKQVPVIYQNQEATPVVDIEDLILFKCYKKSQALNYEFLLQFHLVDKKGKFNAEFGRRMNWMRPAKPTIKLNEKKQPHIVYFLTRSQTFRQYLKNKR
jgi:hypothetical protein